MNNKRFFEITWNDMSVVIEIDTSVLTQDVATEINEFLSNPKHRLSQCADVHAVVAQMFASLFFRWAIDQGGLVGYGESYCEYWVKGTLSWVGEGWPDYEECGIRILRADAKVELPEFDALDLSEVDEDSVV